MIRLLSTLAFVAFLQLGFGAELAGAQDAARGYTASINGIEMYYEVRGDGPPLVLLHGFTQCGRTWEPHVAQLAEAYRLIIPDLRGHGRSTNPSGAFTHRQAAQDVFALLDRLGIERFKGMGISTGGMTLIHMATQHRERVEAMVLIGATVYFPEEARGIMRGTSADSIAREAWDHYRQCHKLGDAQIRALLTQFHSFKDSYDDMNFTDPYLGTITARTLIVHGDRDRFFPVSIPTQMYRGIPRAYLWIVPNGGHVPIFDERAGMFRDIALPFLAGRWESR